MFRIEQLNKAELIEYCKKIGIEEVVGKSKEELKTAISIHFDNEVLGSITSGQATSLLTQKIELLAEEYAANLQLKVLKRKQEMINDDNSHYLIYRVLGIARQEGRLIDEYQNTGRFLYKYAGSFLEEATSICLKFNNLKGGKRFVKNTQGKKPKNFEIDFVDGQYAFEIKWRDATTDGDHITKEHTRIQVVKSQGYIPVRIMFYYPQRLQAQKIQATLKTLYTGVGGTYYVGDDAWSFVREHTGYDLKSILINIANKRMPENGSK
ncbi:ApaLI family restriction endonuclease [Microscilla marina]|uniref:Restriction endonuclease R XbaI n=1 Tax=Microscilla marina ATCC 23134 TaxID=313606 RepID=A1ZH81_MICM2|nr:ApaLI family restriction endonuclease [Microscilla marina]EAY30350.1 restriction endonuclease R XbaI [Microscilla marina ATCC 23134]